MNDLFFQSKQSTYIIAEISANHNGSLETALEMVRIAKDCGADAVKIQTYTADTLTLDCDSEPFLIKGGTLWDGKTLHQLYQEAYTPWEWHAAIFAEAKRIGIECFSTPFDETAVDFLEAYNPPYHKIASFELVHDPLLRKVAETGRPVILSTGMATLEEIAHAVTVLRDGGCGEIALLKCTSAYPAPPEEANLARISHMASTFDCIAGLSDHTLGIAVPIAAVALGARIIEKHLCRSRTENGPDTAFSLEPHEFKEMCSAIRVAEASIGSIAYNRTAKDVAALRFRRSIFAAEEIAPGEIITARNIRVIRPSSGISPSYYDIVIGKRASQAIPRGTPITWDLLQ